MILSSHGTQWDGMDSGDRGSVDGTTWDVPTVHRNGMDSVDRGSVDGTAWDVPTVHWDGMDSGDRGSVDGTTWDVPTLSNPSHGTLGWDGQWG